MTELCETECENIVRKATRQENVKIKHFSTKSFGNYLGFLGEYFRLKIDADVNGEENEFKFFVKSLPIYDLKQRKMLVETGIFRKEVKLYETLLSELREISNDDGKSWCPTVFLCRDDLLVLEDLSLKGYQLLPTNDEFKKSHVEATLKSLASFHSASIAYEASPRNGSKSISNGFGELLFETSVDDISWFRTGLKTITDIALEHTKYGISHGDQLKKNFYEKTFEVIAIMESSPYKVLKVLSHRDIWRNNLMFKFDETSGGFEKPLHCVLLDFQTARYLPVTIDVLMAIVSVANEKSREDFFTYFIEFYYKNLSEQLKKLKLDLSQKMSFENFAKSCNYHKIFALVYNVIVIMVTTIPRSYFVSFSEDEFNEFNISNRSKFVLDYMQKDEKYRKRLVEAVETVIENLYDI